MSVNEISTGDLVSDIINSGILLLFVCTSIYYRDMVHMVHEFCILAVSLSYIIVVKMLLKCELSFILLLSSSVYRPAQE